MRLVSERGPVWGLIVSGICILWAGTTPAQPPEIIFEAHGPAARAIPPLPSPAVFPVQLVLDDGTAEGDFGPAAARQFLWFHRFDFPGGFTLEEIWVLFPTTVPLGGAVELAVYLDADGDPTNGATLLDAVNETVQANDGVTFSVYPLASPILIDSPGDVLIGAVNRYYTTGVDPPPTVPAALDTTASQNRAWFALWPVDPPDPPDLATASTFGLLDGAVSGNWMIRGFGTPQVLPLAAEIPTVTPAGLALLAAVLALAGAYLAYRDRRRKEDLRLRR